MIEPGSALTIRNKAGVLEVHLHVRFGGNHERDS